AKMLITRPMRVRMFGWTRWSDSHPTIRFSTHFPAAPILPLMEWSGIFKVSALLVMHCCEAKHFEFPGSRRDLHFDSVADTFIQQASANWRSGRNQSLGDIGIFTGDELVGDLFV